MRIIMTALHPAGGIRTFFRYIYSQLNFDDCEFTLIAPDNEKSPLSKYLEMYLPKGRITYISVEKNKLLFISKLRKHLKNNAYDIVHSHGFTAGVLTAISNLGVNRPHIMTGHDLFHDWHFQKLSGHIKHLLLSKIFEKIDLVHTVSEDAKLNFQKYFPDISEKNIISILHGIDTNYFSRGIPRPLKAELSISEEISLIGFFGRFMSPKGFRLLVEAMEILLLENAIEPIPHVVTFGWGGFIREDYAYLNNKGLGEYFHQLPRTEQMPEALKGVDLVIIPSRWEACGLLAMEALTAGVPVIGTDCMGLREVLSGTPAHIIKSGDSKLLASAIVRELKNMKSRKQEFSDYSNVAAERFNIKRPASELRIVYDKLKIIREME